MSYVKGLEVKSFDGLPEHVWLHIYEVMLTDAHPTTQFDIALGFLRAAGYTLVRYTEDDDV